jgi:prepilin-type N-terminal cleavage/methylation domain-containing protein
MRCLLFVLYLVPTVLRGNPYPCMKSRRHAGTKHESGFTLLELLVVVVLLGIFAGGAAVGYDRVQDQARIDATRFEMAEIRKALLQFRRDSGTNDFPGQGIYDCMALANAAIDNGGRLDTWPPSVWEIGDQDDKLTKLEWITWCKHPANFWMLFVDPRGEGWDPDTHRGWHGPYLQRKSGLISYGGVDKVWGVVDPYQSPFILVVDPENDDKTRIVSFGPDNTYDGDGANPDDPCEPPTDSGDYDDIVLCLLR